MSVQTNSSEVNKPSNRAKSIFGGSLLILFGLGILLSRWVDFGLLAVAFPGLAMLAWGIFSRDSGWMIPAGILNGIALGIFALEGPVEIVSGETASGGLFLLCFALGWFSIPLFSRLFTNARHNWAFIPGGIMAFIGAVIFFGQNNLKMLESLNYITPAALILGGLYVILRKK